MTKNSGKPFDKSPVYTMLEKLISDRDYTFHLDVAKWTGDYPSIFRSVYPLRISNQRHVLVDCEKIDKDPKIEDMTVMSACGTGYGVTYDGQLGIVSHGAPYGSYFLPKRDKDGVPVIVERQYTGDNPDKGNPIRNIHLFNYYLVFSS